MITETPTLTGFSDRPHGPRRSRRITVSYTDDEFASILAASQSAGLTPTGYVAESALAVARDGEPPETSPWRHAIRELMAARTQVRKIGVNINQAARVLNATGDPPVWLEQAARITGHAVARLDKASTALIEVASHDQVARRRLSRKWQTPSTSQERT